MIEQHFNVMIKSPENYDSLAIETAIKFDEDLDIREIEVVEVQSSGAQLDLFEGQ